MTKENEPIIRNLFLANVELRKLARKIGFEYKPAIPNMHRVIFKDWGKGYTISVIPQYTSYRNKEMNRLETDYTPGLFEVAKLHDYDRERDEVHGHLTEEEVIELIQKWAILAL